MRITIMLLCLFISINCSYGQCSVNNIPFGVNYTFATQSCDAFDGHINASLASGFNPNGVRYIWSTGATTETISGLSAGVYGLSIEDIYSGCKSVEAIVVPQDPVCVARILGHILDYIPYYACTNALTPYNGKVGEVLLLTDGVDSIFTLTDNAGYFEFEVGLGNYSLRHFTQHTDSIVCLNGPIQNINVTSYKRYSLPDYVIVPRIPNDFRIHNIAYDPPKQGTSIVYKLVYSNLGMNQQTATVQLKHDELITDLQITFGNTPVYDTINRLATWSSLLNSRQTKHIFYNYTIPASVPIGTEICDTAFISPIANDDTPGNNTFVFCRTVEASYAPNEKRTLFGASKYGGEFTADDSPFMYEIRYENTGLNTAINMVIRDTLDPNLDLTTLDFLDKRHWYTPKLVDNHILEFWFENINLPSNGQPYNYGFLLYELKPKDNLDICTEISNTASIYFDNQPPIYTNTVVNTLRPNEGLRFSGKVFLEGAINSATGMLESDLVSLGLLPLEEPYSGLGFNFVNGVFCESTNLSVLDQTGADAIVDWVFLELREAGDPSIVVATRAALLKANGEIVDTDGISPVLFGEMPPANYYVAIQHRNHLGVMTPAALYLDEQGTASYDFTTGNAFGGNAQKQITSGMFGLFAGDFDHSGSIDANDRSISWNFRNQQGYLSQDASLNGVCDAVERSLAWNNRNVNSYLP